MQPAGRILSPTHGGKSKNAIRAAARSSSARRCSVPRTAPRSPPGDRISFAFASVLLEIGFLPTSCIPCSREANSICLSKMHIDCWSQSYKHLLGITQMYQHSARNIGQLTDTLLRSWFFYWCYEQIHCKITWDQTFADRVLYICWKWSGFRVSKM